MLPTVDVQFFRRQGFTPCRAVALVRAEEYMVAQGWGCAWATDFGGDLGDHSEWCERAAAGEACTHEVLHCVLRDSAGRPLASLGNIIDADRAYARVVVAELAEEAMAEAERPYCRPLASGLQSSERAVASRLARLVNGLDEINGNVAEGRILDNVTSLRRTLLGSLRADGWRVDYVEDRHRWRVRAPQRRR